MDIRIELDRVVRQEGVQLVQFAYQLTRSSSAAQDLVQDALLSVLRAGESPDLAIRNIKAYLVRTISNGFLRSHRSKHPEPLPLEEAVDTQDGIEHWVDGVVDRDLLWQLLGTLPEKMRLVLVLRYFLDQPDDQIADIIDASTATVRSVSSRALARLRGQYADNSDEEARNRS